jgi:hypothetical protein
VAITVVRRQSGQTWEGESIDIVLLSDEVIGADI